MGSKNPLSRYKCQNKDVLQAPQTIVFIDWGMKKVAKEKKKTGDLRNGKTHHITIQTWDLSDIEWGHQTEHLARLQKVMGPFAHPLVASTRIHSVMSKLY